MSFGKRTVSPQDPRRLDRSTPAPVRSTKGRFGIAVADLAIGAAVLLATFFGGYFLLGGFSGASTPVSTQPPAAARFASEPAPLSRAYNKKGTIPFLVDADWMMTLEMHETAEGFDAIDSELHERCMKHVSEAAAVYAEKRGRTFLKPARGAEFLACSMRIYRSRFCDDDYRERLVARLNEFVRARREHIATVEDIRGTKVGRMMIEVDKASRKNAGGITSGYRPAEFVPHALGAQIRALSKAGFISQDDFGGLFSSVPEELTPYLAAETGTPPCG